VGVSIRFTDADRARLGVVDEWLAVDYLSVTGREAAVLQHGFDLDGEHVCFPSPSAWRKALVDTKVLDEQGNEILVDVLDADGQPVLDEQGQPRRVPKRRPHWGAELVVGWLALRRVGIHVPLAELDYDMDGLRMRTAPDPDTAATGDPGKDPASTPPTTSNS